MVYFNSKKKHWQNTTRFYAAVATDSPTVSLPLHIQRGVSIIFKIRVIKTRNLTGWIS